MRRGEKRGVETKISKREGKLGQGVGALKKKGGGDWNSLTNYDYEQVNASWELFLCAFLL